jgi:hypothetical protein
MINFMKEETVEGKERGGMAKRERGLRKEVKEKIIESKVKSTEGDIGKEKKKNRCTVGKCTVQYN